jgi:phosphate transport system permease protein
MTLEQSFGAVFGERAVLISAEQAHLLRRKLLNHFMTGLLTALTALSVAILFVIVLNIFQNGIGAINADFFLKVHAAPDEGGGIAQAILGTLFMLAMAAVVSVPLGILVAIFLSEFGHGWFAEAVRFVVDLLLQMPSIVIGIFVWATLVRATNYSAFAGSVALAIIMTPIVIRSVEEMLRLVPDTLREAGYALGAPQWRIVLGVVIPTVRPGIITGVVLSMARAAGESAPLLLTALGNSFINWNPMAPTAAIPLQIFAYAQDGSLDFQHKAWAATLVLIVVIAIFSAFVRTFSGRVKHES